MILGIKFPEIAVVDNCCHVQRAIKEVFEDIEVVLDVYHFMRRYVDTECSFPIPFSIVLAHRYITTIHKGSKNPHYATVAQDVVNAILKKHAQDGQTAQYWPQDEQERCLINVYDQWAKKGGIWSAATSKVSFGCSSRLTFDGPCIQVHDEQLHHVRKGCLVRSWQDISTDGSRIEGSHKGWNSLQ
jgi:hypothetical protein